MQMFAEVPEDTQASNALRTSLNAQAGVARATSSAASPSLFTMTPPR